MFPDLIFIRYLTIDGKIRNHVLRFQKFFVFRVVKYYLSICKVSTFFHLFDCSYRMYVVAGITTEAQKNESNVFHNNFYLLGI